ncbi:Inorganic phosphate transporter pho84 [Aspergillus tanneri]|uniref:Inorganic phosphate transporter pho84 n=1 Tax=Aspergillus tanneri TaxID=1220188 RepID=A0A5M9MSY2_9EURO|nr:Inorganic phosphate transporter pho84 [Aspergillus tanneri]KAA8650175.1 Inorganic phosphate transporter pho84 [Aspergillus tanneri]
MDSRQDQDRSLTNTTAQTEIEKVASLRLIADSVAQQRQVAANALIRHPLWLGLMTIALAVTYQCLHTDCSDWPIILMTWTGCIMTGLTVVRFLTAPYLDQAEKTGTWKWLYDGIEKSGDKNKKTDHILITKFGSEIVGVLVLRPVYTRSELKSHIQGAQEMGTQTAQEADDVECSTSGFGVIKSGKNLIWVDIECIRNRN